MTTTELILTILTSLGFGGLLGKFIFDLATRHLKRGKEEERKDEIVKVINDTITPQIEKIQKTLNDNDKKYDEKFNSIETQLKMQAKGVVTLLRDSLKIKRDMYISKGFVTPTEKSLWKEELEEYRNLGGNHWKQFMSTWEEQVNNLEVKDDKSSEEIFK